MAFARHEDKRLVTGTGKFSADWNLPEQLHACTVRSLHAHAKLLSVDVSAALAVEGVITVLTAADVTAAKMSPLPSGPDLKGIGDTDIIKGMMPILAIDRVRFVGQPIAMVIAESANIARDASELVEITYEELAVVTNVESAQMADAAQLHPQAPGNVSLEFESGDAKATEAAFASADKTAALTINSQRLYGAPMEPRALVVNHDQARGVTVVRTPTQGMLGMRAALAAMTGLPADELEIVAEDVGGSFGLRGGPASEHALMVLAARRYARPIKWVSTRSELFTAEWHGRALTLKGEIAIDANNQITAIRFEDTADLGAYNCFFGGFIGTSNLAVTMGGAYQVPALYMKSRLVYTNQSPVSAYRGAGRPDIAFAIERLIEHAAAEHQLDPIEFRKLNFVARDAFPYTTANGTVYDCGDFHTVMDKALTLADYKNFASREKLSQSQGKLRGIGIGYYVEKSGAGGAPKDEVSCRFNADGTISLFAVSGPSGQGHETAYAQIVGEGLGIKPALMHYLAGDPGQQLVGNGTGGSRSLYGTGSAFKNLVEAIIARAKPHAAQALNVEPGDVVFAGGRFLGRNGAKGIDLMELVANQFQSIETAEDHPFNCSAETVTGSNFPNGCHIAEVEIDRETGITEVVKYSAIDELGNVLSPTLVRGQVHGGVVQGLGQALMEEMVYDETGQLLSGSFMDYAMPRAGDLSDIQSDTHSVPTELNELGSKGVGESGCSGSLPCVSNAMMAALRSAELGPMDMPYSPHRVWQHLQKAH